MMKLPNGITGFYEKENEPPKMDGKQFKQVCFSLVTNNRGLVLNYNEPYGGTNFFDVEVKVFNKHFHVLLNAHYPFLAFASVVNFKQINFVDEPQLFEQFSYFYSVLETKELNEPLFIKLSSIECILQNDNELNSAELKQLIYWKPERIGDLIFNFWD
ncbi:hypothetical protein V7152_03250 [Neobacillus drentensis]